MWILLCIFKYNSAIESCEQPLKSPISTHHCSMSTSPLMWISAMMKPEVVVTIAKLMTANKDNSDDLPPNLRTQKVISK